MWIRTGGRSGLALDLDGRVAAVDTTLGPLSLGAPTGGLFVRDPVSGEKLPVTGTVGRSGASLVQRAVVPSMQLEVEVDYRRVGPAAVQVSGAVIDQTGADRVIDTVFELPLGISSGTLEINTIASEHLPFDPATQPAKQLALPMANVLGPDRAFSLAYAIDPDHPSRFEMGVEPGDSASTFYVRQMWGLSAAAGGELRSRAPFSFVIDLGVDPVWGYRSALQRYYDRFPEWFANPAGERFGYGVWQDVPRSYNPEQDFLAYHVGGRGKDTLTRTATTLDEFAENDEWAADQANGVATLPYTIPGQREITFLPALPTTYEEAIAAFEAWQGDPVLFGAPNSPCSFDSVEQLKEMITHSALHEPSGNLVISKQRGFFGRDIPWGGFTVTFVTNANPRLFAGEENFTVAKYLLDRYVPWMLSNQFVDGITLDSLFGWSRFFNYRTDHYAAATIPLSYADRTNDFGTAHVPGLYNDFSVLEFVWELRKRLHAEGKILIANGIRRVSTGATPTETRAFDGFACDVFVTENRFPVLLAREGDMAFSRSVGFRKPVAIMVGEPWVDEAAVATLWAFSLLYGISPESHSVDSTSFASAGPLDTDNRSSQLEIDYQNLYYPVHKRLMAAGWEPVTGVQPSEPTVRVERYGPASDFYLVIYNLGAEQAVSFTVDTTALPGIDEHDVRDVLNDDAPAAVDLARALMGQGSVTLPAREVQVLHFTP